MSSRRIGAFLAVVASLHCTPPAEPYDLVILGGRVIDPASGLYTVRNVGIVAAAVAVVTDAPIAGTDTIDATGLVVAPGFLDILAGYPNTDEAAIYKVFDGVTSVVSMHGGPVETEAWYEERTRAGAYHHFGTTVGHGALRQAVGLDDPYRAASPEQIEEMIRLGRRALDVGAVGVGFGIMYDPGTSRQEVLRLFALAAAEDVPVHAHIRYFGDTSPDVNDLAAVEEIVAAAAVTGASAQIVHINSMVSQNMETALWMLEGARARGLDVMADLYPYTASSTGLESTAFDPGWQERYGGIDYADIELVSNGERLTAESFARLRAAGGARVIIHYMPEHVIERALAHPLVMVASDGVISEGRGHPRGAGTFARVLGRYVRERGVLGLPEAIRKMTLLPAQRLERGVPAMARKGRLASGADADVVVFDPETVSDRATFADPAQRSVGMRWVIVAGEVVVADGRLREGTRPGRSIRRE